MSENEIKAAPFTAAGNPRVSTTRELQQALAAGFDPKAIIVEPPGADASDAAVAAAVATAVAAERATFEGERIAWAAERARLIDQAMSLNLPEQEDGIRLQERNRVLEIQKLTRPGFENVARRCIDEGMNVAAFALEQLTAQADRGITLDAIRRDAPPPVPHAAPPSPDAKPGIDASWDRAMARATGARNP